MIPLVLDPVVVAAVVKACADFVKLQGSVPPVIQPVTEPEKPAAATVESARPFQLS